MHTTKTKLLKERFGCLVLISFSLFGDLLEKIQKTRKGLSGPRPQWPLRPWSGRQSKSCAHLSFGKSVWEFSITFQERIPYTAKFLFSFLQACKLDFHLPFGTSIFRSRILLGSHYFKRVSFFWELPLRVNQINLSISIFPEIYR